MCWHHQIFEAPAKDNEAPAFFEEDAEVPGLLTGVARGIMSSEKICIIDETRNMPSIFSEECLGCQPSCG